jgi:peptidoglycan/xylan/chitin deacetylase (PgdA/CDA1 family)
VKRALPALVALLALAAAPAAHAVDDKADSPGSPLDLASATVRQDGTDLILSLRTRGDWASRVLTARRGRSLCLILFQGPRRFICASATARGRPSLTSTRAGGNTSALSARIERPDLRSFTARFAASAVGLRTGKFSWIVTSTWADSKRCAPGRPVCGDRLPDTGNVAASLVPPTPTGCRARSPWSFSNGSRSRRVVALTFDDGPGPYTHQILDILKRNGVHATFFLIGQQVSGGAAILKRALREGNALANHSWNHSNLAGGGAGQLSSTQAAIRRATGYTPCVFRPPYGATSSLLVGQARAQGLDTILWDVDPRDWARPGSGAIYSNVVGHTRPGSIILSHDAGGPREQTVAAYRSIIPTLKRRGYRFATVPELLGLKPTYG